MRPAIARALGLARRASAWTPARLFLDSAAGAWYDPSDLSTLWQDTAGTTPVTTDGQSVARVDDKSGNGHNATQATAAACPVYRTSGGVHWLDFDGVDDALTIPTGFAGLTLDFVLRLSGIDTAGNIASVLDSAGGQVISVGTWQDTNTSAVAGAAPYVDGAAVTNTRDAFHDALTGATRKNGEDRGVAMPATANTVSLLGNPNFTGFYAVASFFGGVICENATMAEGNNRKALQAYFEGAAP